jgi:predicted TIM-barrel fold metal-dependent hydrolase
MTEKTVSRRTMLAGTAGVLGGAALGAGTAHPQTGARPAVAVPGSAPPGARYGDPAWWAQRQEEILEPALEIVDPHHHLWDRKGHRYLLDQLLADTGSGQNIAQSVFVECGSMYRVDGPAELKPVGEIEFVNGTSAMSASGQYGKSRLCAGIVGHADLRLGDGVARVLEAEIAAGDGRFRGIRHSVTWDPSETFSRGRTNSPKGQMADPTWRAGFARLAPLNLTFEAWLYHPQLIELAELARAFPQTTIVLNHVGGPLGIGPYADKKEETFAVWRAGIAEQVPERRRQARRARHAVRHVRLPQAPDAAFVGGAGARVPALYRDLHRGVRPRSRHVRKQLPAGWRQLQLRRPVERLQAPRRRSLGGREGETVQRHRKTRLPPRLAVCRIEPNAGAGPSPVAQILMPNGGGRPAAAAAGGGGRHRRLHSIETALVDPDTEGTHRC